MFKKLKLFLKFLIVGSLWSAFWIVLTQQLVFFVWKFNYISLKQWHLVREFWRQNGVIKGYSDYLLFVSLLAVILIWYFGFKKLYHVNYVELILKPFTYFSKKRIEKYADESKHIVIKNLVVGEKLTVDDLVNEKIKEEKNSSGQKESESLRQNIAQKISEQKGK